MTPITASGKLLVLSSAMNTKPHTPTPMAPKR